MSRVTRHAWGCIDAHSEPCTSAPFQGLSSWSAGMLRLVVHTEGVKGLYRGIAPTLLGIVPYAGLKFYVYQSAKARYLFQCTRQR